MSVVYNCPPCEAQIAFKHRFSKMAMCGLCKQISMVESENLLSANMKSELAENPYQQEF